MPNHVQNSLKVVGTPAQIIEVFNFISSVDEENGNKIKIDFNKIIPMPESLMVEDGSLGDLALKIFHKMDIDSWMTMVKAKKRFGNLSDGDQKKAKELGDTYAKNIKKYGCKTWYNWAIDNWDTKWNAYSCDDERNTDDTIYFQTAWSAPIKVIKKLSKLFPDVQIELDYADEDSGSNTGKYVYQNNKCISKYEPKDQSNEGYKLYFELHPGTIYMYKLVDGKYEYDENSDN